jgi:hypothetical protein
MDLVALAPRSGMAACAMLAVAGEALLIGFGGPAVWRDPSNTDFVLFCTTGFAGAAPLLVGGAIARRRMIMWGIPTLGPRPFGPSSDDKGDSGRVQPVQS